MGIWDDLLGRLRQTSEAAKKEATRRATQAAVDQVKKRVSDAADDFLGAAEKELEEAEAARKGRTTYAPSPESSTADDIIQRAQQAEDTWKQRQRPAHPTPEPEAAPTPPPAPKLTHAEQKAARRSRAEAELEALKRRLGREDD